MGSKMQTIRLSLI